MSVEHAAELWRKNVLPMKEKCEGVRVGSPAISNGPNGIPWLKEFFEKLGGISSSGIDHVVIHYYSPDVKNFKRHVQEVYETFKMPVWVTEFACTTWDPAHPASEKDVLLFLNEAIGFLDESSFVQRYAWFGAIRDVGEGVGRANGLQRDGKLSEAGKLYTTI